jgi:hypothetical protein
MASRGGGRNKQDLHAMSSMTMATEIRPLESIRDAQVNAAGLVWALWPGDEEAMIDALQTLGLLGRTGLEVYGPDGELLAP